MCPAEAQGECFLPGVSGYLSFSLLAAPRLTFLLSCRLCRIAILALARRTPPELGLGHLLYFLNYVRYWEENQRCRPHRTKGRRSCVALGPLGEEDVMVTVEPILISKNVSSILSEDAQVRGSSPQTNSLETSQSKAILPNNQLDNRPTRIQNATFLQGCLIGKLMGKSFSTI